MPELWHWLYFLPTVPLAEVGPDGHPKRGGFLPPVELDRRMWAGGRLTFHGQLRVGDAVRQRSEILKVSEKDGRAGRMVFVTVRHETGSERGLAIEEEQDIVYVAMPTAWVAPEPVPRLRTHPVRDRHGRHGASVPVLRGDFQRPPHPLRPAYATEVENYPGLMVHGPLQAMLLIDIAKRRQPGRRPRQFSFRGVRPLFHYERPELFVGRAEGGHDLLVSNGVGPRPCRPACTGQTADIVKLLMACAWSRARRSWRLPSPG